MSVGAAGAVWSRKARPAAGHRGRAVTPLDPEHNGVTHMAIPLRAGASLKYMITLLIMREIHAREGSITPPDHQLPAILQPGALAIVRRDDGDPMTSN